ncbi:chromate efflux transporter [Hydrogenovibrio kuenenii]|uniref:chromate efflux transporter n=1 Tax=Hydrogenovibrio kuenenii TaxID=63658 RepID=UPI0004635DDD|nr:chromate efflux transporter [Hydrogenovibrio kuenenii]
MTDTLKTEKASTPNVDISFVQALIYWLKLGFISFGGPAGQISLMHQELVEKRRWISEKRFLNALNYTMLLPGPEAQQLATYMGWLMHGTKGGLAAGLLFILPAFFLLMFLSWLYLTFGQVSWVAAVFYGIKPAVLAIVVVAVYRLASRVLHHAALWWLAVGAFVAIAVFNWPFPLIMISALIIGLIFSHVAPQVLSGSASVQTVNDSKESALIGDDTVLEHTRFAWHKLIKVVLLGVFIWLAAMLSLVALTGGADSPLVQMAWFFTKAAWLTFGGAYAVLPYVYQGAVEHFHWLTAPQMIDGLALGETTPGPLIMIVTFIGFVAGWGQMAVSDASPFVNGFLAASVVTFFSFLPSFLLILAGAPLVEAGRENGKLKGLLTVISAALVGVMLNLAVFFGFHVFWPHPPNLNQGLDAWLAIDLTSLFITGLAMWLLFKKQWGFIPVILLSAVLGLLTSFI